MQKMLLIKIHHPANLTLLVESTQLLIHLIAHYPNTTQGIISCLHQSELFFFVQYCSKCIRVFILTSYDLSHYKPEPSFFMLILLFIRIFVTALVSGTLLFLTNLCFCILPVAMFCVLMLYQLTLLNFHVSYYSLEALALYRCFYL